MVDRGRPEERSKMFEMGTGKEREKLYFRGGRVRGGVTNITGDLSLLSLFVSEICTSLRNVHSLLCYGYHVCV